MTTDIALFMIPRDMKALGYGEDDYIADFRHYVVKAASTLQIKGDNEYFYLIGQAQGVSITSAFGTFDLNDTGTNELQHKHQGTITIKNYTKKVVRIKFMQAILKQK